jgi:hypothetical protein
VPRRVGLALPDRRQASPATSAFIELATELLRSGALNLAVEPERTNL